MSKAERRFDKHGEIRLMAMVDGWCLVRRPRCTPFAISASDWLDLPTDSIEPQTPVAHGFEPSGARR
jgi:hypothetical protein